MKNVLIPLEKKEHSSVTVGAKNYIRETYMKKLQNYDLLPVFVSHVMSDAAVEQKFSQASGMLLMGGLDIDSSRYTDDPAHEKSKSSPVRDELEFPLIQRALDNNLPILGICRGCQALAVADGGSLYQHLPEMISEETHGKSVDGEGYGHIADVEHTIYVEPESRLEQIVGQREVVVNSGHHQAIKDPGDNFRITAETPAGVVEAIEHEGDFFCIGLQSHPEAQQDGPLEGVFQAFKAAVEAK
jgi:putative glutamine amidotransferase